MGEKYYNMYYYKGNNGTLSLIEQKYGILFCEVLKFYGKEKEESEYFDPVKNRYIIKSSTSRKNTKLKYFYYDTEIKDFVEIIIKDNRIYNKKYSAKFFNDNFDYAHKIMDKIDLIMRLKKIEKIKKTLI